MKIDDSKVPGKEKFPFPAEEITNRFLYEVLPDRSWKGKPCIIVGGGPSLEDFDWNLLHGWRVIGINRVYERFDPTIIFSMDTRFLRWVNEEKYGKEATEKFANSKAYKVWLCTYNCKLPDDIFIVKVWQNYSRGFRAFPNTMNNGIGHGNNSGYGALNLAVCLGANPIYLLGYDMSYRGGEDSTSRDARDIFLSKVRTHWHEGHPQPHKIDTASQFIKYYKLPAIKAKEWGIEVINLNRKSALPYFSKRHYEEVLQ